MDQQGRLTPGDPGYVDFCEKWGETPQGEKLSTCQGCRRALGHGDSCTGRGFLGYERELWDKVQRVING